MTWAIDRLGRSLIDLIQDLEAIGVDLYLDQQRLDTPTGKLLFHVTGAFSEFKRSMIRRSGIFLATFRRKIPRPNPVKFGS
jgi:DNA invertase Pin-like site-specific DNA recombinase